MRMIFPHGMRRTWALTTSVALMAATTLVSACAGDGALGPRGTHAVSLSFMTAPTTGTALADRLLRGDMLFAPGTRPAASILAVTGTDTLVITKAQIVLSRLELAQGTGASCDEDDNAPGCAEVERSFVLVDLPVDTAVRATMNATVPAGTYTALEAKLRVAHPDSDDQAHDATAFLAAHPEFQGANVRVEGTFRGTPFVYTGTVNAELDMGFSPPITVDSSGLNITIRVDLATWFRDGTGALIDPSTANAGGTNTQLVLDNIRRSFHAFRDDHRDGHDDGDSQGETQHDGAGTNDGGDGGHG